MSTSFPASTSSSSTRPEAAGRAPSRPRPSLLVGALAGAGAALLGVVVCAVVGLLGWYLSAAGGHGEPRLGLLVGARGWLVGHGAGFSVEGTAVTMLPLGLTAGLAWVVWQSGLRLGEAVWDHGPDEYARLDGSRDLTVPLALAGFVMGYLAVALVTSSVTGGADWEPSTGAVVGWALCLSGLLGGAGVLVGSGRAEQWAWSVPLTVQDAVYGAGALLRAWLTISLVLFVVAMAVGMDEAADTVRALETSNGETFLLVLACLLVLPQAVLFASAFLLGPGFAVGAGTAVAPGGVVLGPLPLVPILGALPDEGTTSSFWVLHAAVPVVLAAVVLARRHARLEVVGWNASLLAGAGAGLGAAALLGLLTSLADGAVGPGRMSEVGADAFAVFTAAVLPLVGGAVCGAALGTWWARRGWEPDEVDEADEADDAELDAGAASGAVPSGAVSSGAVPSGAASSGAVVIRGSVPGEESSAREVPAAVEAPEAETGPEETVELLLAGVPEPDGDQSALAGFTDEAPVVEDSQTEDTRADEPQGDEPQGETSDRGVPEPDRPQEERADAEDGTPA